MTWIYLPGQYIFRTPGIDHRKFYYYQPDKKVKQLICNQDLNITEISRNLNYSSVGHLSTQFKNIPGVTPSCFKHLTYKSPVVLEMCE
ncbi:AraC family transcriptional regulator [Mucilaginibacter sp. UYCu711]|uniref:AraC family transcriptional regulator n=1 Tax=Mucilaginibacter sp. UYCu711 TaxID=3156339 RepID=UPI003D234ADA